PDFHTRRHASAGFSTTLTAAFLTTLRVGRGAQDEYVTPAARWRLPVTQRHHVFPEECAAGRNRKCLRVGHSLTAGGYPGHSCCGAAVAPTENGRRRASRHPAIVVGRCQVSQSRTDGQIARSR